MSDYNDKNKTTTPMTTPDEHDKNVRVKFSFNNCRVHSAEPNTTKTSSTTPTPLPEKLKKDE